MTGIRRRRSLGAADPRLRLVRTLVAWVGRRGAVWVAAAILPGVTLGPAGAAFVVAGLIAVINAVLPPVIAALRLPFTVAIGFLLVLLADALLLLAADGLPDDIHVDSFGDALLAALLIAAVTIVLQVIARHQRRRRVHAARHAPRRQAPGRGSAHRRARDPLPRDRRARAAGAARRDARRQRADDGALDRRGRLPPAEWETDLSSQTGASQAGILLGSNEDIPAFRWVEKETGR